MFIQNKKTWIPMVSKMNKNEIKNGVLFFNPGESAGMRRGSNAIGILDVKNLETKRIFF